MSTVTKIYLNEYCKGEKLSLCDVTKPYNAADNLGGYGTPNELDGPGDFDSLVLELTPPEGDPISINLIPLITAPDAYGVYHYEWTAEALGLSYFQSGQWRGVMTGVAQGVTYVATWDGVFTNHIQGLIDTEILSVDPAAPVYQKKSDLDAILAGARRLAGRCGNVKKAVRTIEWLYANYRNCC